MPTRTPEQNPFAPRSTLTREQFLDQVQGMTPSEHLHEVEHALEGDPLMQEALEGASLPGAAEGLASLDEHRPGRPPPTSGSNFWLIGGVLVGALLIGVTWYIVPPSQEIAPDGYEKTLTLDAMSDPEQGEDDLASPLDDQEILGSVEQPESLRIGHEVDELHTLAMQREPRVVREQGVERIEARSTTDGVSKPVSEKRPAGSRRSSRQLFYVYDLKLVHPKELYGNDPLMPAIEHHVAARHGDLSAQEQSREPQRTKAYIPYMTVALGKFTRNDHKGCLEDLRFLLAQYPEDVNALFYAGLCSYNLGLYSRARSFLDRSAHNPIDTFDEESEWYHALTLDRMGDRDEARSEYARIIAQKGFYAERAQERMTVK